MIRNGRMNHQMFNNAKDNNMQILDRIKQYKKMIVEAREEKLKYDLQINRVQKNIKEFEEKKELKRRELLNELLPVTKTPKIDRGEGYRKIQTAPENAKRSLRGSHRRNIQSAKLDTRIKEAIKDSIQALPGISENLNSPSMVEAFRQSYIRDLHDYLKIKEERGEAMPDVKESIPVDKNFSFKKKSLIANSLSNNKNTEIEESSVIRSKNDSQISGSRGKNSTLSLKNQRLIHGKHPKINYKKSINQLSGVNDSEIQLDRELGFDPRNEIIETIEEAEGERDTYFGNEEGEENEARKQLDYEENKELEMEFEVEDDDEDFNDYKNINGSELQDPLSGPDDRDSYQKMSNVPTFRPKETFGLEPDKGIEDTNQSQNMRSTEDKIIMSNSGDYEDIPIVDWNKQDSISEESFSSKRSSNVMNSSASRSIKSRKKKRSFRIRSGSSSRQSTASMRSNKAARNTTENDFIDFKIQEGLERRTETLTPNIDKHALKKNEIIKNFEFNESDISFLKKKESVKYKTMNNQKFVDDDSEFYGTGEMDKARTQANFSRRNKMIIDRFDEFFNKMDIKEEKEFEDEEEELKKSEKQTPKPLQKSYKSKTQSRYKSYSNYSDINNSDNEDEFGESDLQTEFNEDYSNEERPITRERPTNRLRSADFDDLSKELKDQIEIGENTFSGEGTDKTVLTGYKESYGYSEVMDDEAIELSQGTKDIKNLFKNRLHLNKTSKSNRYGYNGDVE